MIRIMRDPMTLTYHIYDEDNICEIPRWAYVGLTMEFFKIRTLRRENKELWSFIEGLLKYMSIGESSESEIMSFIRKSLEMGVEVHGD